MSRSFHLGTLDLPNDTKVSTDTFVQWSCLGVSGSIVSMSLFHAYWVRNEQSDYEVQMRFYLRQLTVEEGDGGNVTSRGARTAVHPILDWFDDLGVYHQLILSGPDVVWLSKVKVSIRGQDT
jgi:hypothetical protein